jgi:hypothetical protein
MVRIFAYLDPGTGATLTQLLLAGTVGIGVIVKMKWHSVRSFFDRTSSDSVDLPTVADTERAAVDDDEFTS